MSNKHRHVFSCLLLTAGISLCGSAQAVNPYPACDACHGTHGISHGSHIPSIAGLNFQYFYTTMQDYKRERRDSTIMSRIAKGFGSSKLQYMALYYGSQSWTGNPREEFDAGLAEKGQNIYQTTCIECHEYNGHYQDRKTPALAGQSGGYLLYLMEDYRDGGVSTRQPAIMEEQLQTLSDNDLKALAEFFSSSLAINDPEVVAPE